MAGIHTAISLTDNITSVLTNINNALNMTIGAFYDVQDASSNVIDTSAFAAIQEYTNAATIGLRHLRDEAVIDMKVNAPDAWLSDVLNAIPDNPIEVPVTAVVELPEWNIQSSAEIFSSNGLSRMSSEMQSLNSVTDTILSSQRNINEQALAMDILPPNASWDINDIAGRVETLGVQLQDMQNMDTTFMDAGAIGNLNREIESVRMNLNNVVNIQESMNQALEAGDISSLNQGYERLRNTVDQTERRIRDSMAAMQEMSYIQWASPPSVDVFQGNGLERYQQEVQSVNTMLGRMSEVQQQIQNQSHNTNLFPQNMVNDMNSINARISAIQNGIMQIQNRPISNIGAAQANAEMERLRGQLNHLLVEQGNLNSAMEQMDISAANVAYNRLNSIVESTERNIRDNVNAQEQFNNQIAQGQSAADGLTGKITRMAAAYLSIQGAQRVLNLSDTIASNAARLELIVDDGGSVQELEQRIFASSQRARGSFLATSQAVSKLGLLAGNAFSGTDEIIAFTELMNKNFAIGGASIQEQTSAMYQLTQAMAAGKLQGDEYRSIIENAPLLAGAIEQYMTDAGVEGTMKDWASEGLLTADVIKNALFNTVDETNERFNSMPITFSQAAQNIRDSAIMAFQPVLNKLNEIANSQGFQEFTQKLSVAFSRLSGAILEIFDLAMMTGQFISDNWGMIAPVVFGIAAAYAIYNGVLLLYNTYQTISNGIKAIALAREALHTGATLAQAAAARTATGAQVGLNAAMLASPITLIIMAIIALITLFYVVVGAINKLTGTSTSATGLIFGAFFWLGSVIANIFFGLLDIVFGIVNAMVNPFIRFANFIGNFMNDPISAVIYQFQGMADGALAMIQKIASAMDWVFGSHMADTISDWRAGLKEMADEAVRSRGYNPEDFNQFTELDLSVKGTLGIDRFDNTDAFMAGYDIGEGIADKVSGFFDFNSLGLSEQDDLFAGVQATAYNTDEMRKSMGMSADNLKYLRDIAERDVINRFTTAELKIDFSSSNTINNNMDIDGLVSDLEDRVTEVLVTAAEGVHF